MPPAMPPDSDDDDEGDSADGATALLAKCSELKSGGNDLFKVNELGAATTTYQEAIDKLTSDPAKKALGEYFKANPDAPDTASPLLASLHTNLAACHVKLAQWESAVQAAAAAPHFYQMPGRCCFAQLRLARSSPARKGSSRQC